MPILEAVTSPQPFAAAISQASYVKAGFTDSRISQYQLIRRDGQNITGHNSAVTISLSISAIRLTTGLLSAEKNIDDTKPEGILSKNDIRAGGIENALKNLLAELAENNDLTGNVAKRLSKLVNILNTVRGTDTKLGQLTQDDRNEVLSAQEQVNKFFREKHATNLVDANLENFITLISKLETLREFTLRTADLLSALKDKSNEKRETKEIPPATQINITT